MTGPLPSSADLAAFRRRIHNTNPAEDHGLYEPCYVDDVIPTVWPGEREHGIGRITPGAAHQTLSGVRREASALRSRAYARACVAASPGPCADCGAIGWHTRACRADWPALP